MRIVRVQFPQTPTKVYDYDVPPDFAEITPDMFVVVDSPYGGYTVVKVVEVTTGTEYAHKPIVDIVDDTEYKAYQAAFKRRREIEYQLMREDEKVSKLQKYEHLATINPEAAELLAELKKLNGIKDK